jgi:lycopene cyclase CruP
MTSIQTSLARLPQDVRDRLYQANQLWYNLRHEPPNIPTAIRESRKPLRDIDWDVVISGGTLGILLAAALQRQGLRVAIIERGILKGREQEWNISRQELKTFLDLELLSVTELEQTIVSEYNPARISFFQGYELWVEDVLNIGVDPVCLLHTLKTKFLQAGGTLLEKNPFKYATIHPDGVVVETVQTTLKARLLIDAMGHFSPIAQQARRGAKPQGVCLVVGSCAQGYQHNETGDLIVSSTPILHQCQYFWEAFPARDGRTTYLFTYLDTHPQRFSLEFFMAEYFRLLPEYQNIDLDKLDFKRFLFGFFPAYQKSPLQLPWKRILAVGDSSGSQSPVSFGGFGAMVRHLKRLAAGINEALKADTLKQNDLSLLQPYQPNLSVTWLFQKTMSLPITKKANPNQINELMSGVFQVMDELGDEVLKPFLQDVIQFPALAKTLILVNPKLVLPLLPQLGIMTLVDWGFHYFNLALYSGLYPLAKTLNPLMQNLPPVPQYYCHRWLDAWEYGAGKDIKCQKKQHH